MVLQEFGTYNRAFHFSIIELSRMNRLSRLIRKLWDALDIYRTVYFRDPVNRERIHAEHQEIIDALKVRYAQALIRAQSNHGEHASRPGPPGLYKER